MGWKDNLLQLLCGRWHGFNILKTAGDVEICPESTRDYLACKRRLLYVLLDNRIVKVSTSNNGGPLNGFWGKWFRNHQILLCVLHIFWPPNFKRFYWFIFRGEGREERNISVWLPLTWPPLGTWPITQACALTGNWISNPVLCRPALNPLSHTSQSLAKIFEEEIGCVLYMGIMITYHRYNNPMYNVHKNVDAHYIWQNMGSKIIATIWVLNCARQHEKHFMAFISFNFHSIKWKNWCLENWYKFTQLVNRL